MKQNFAKIFLGLVLFGTSTLAYSGPYCPVNNTVKMTCNQVAMEALWLRVANNLNYLLFTDNNNFINAINTDAQSTFQQITAQVQPNSPQGVVATSFNNWWVAINNYTTGSSPSPIQTTGITLAQNLAIYAGTQGGLSQDDEQDLFNNLQKQFIFIVADIENEFNSYKTNQFGNGLEFSTSTTLALAYIGVSVGKALEGEVVAP